MSLEEKRRQLQSEKGSGSKITAATATSPSGDDPPIPERMVMAPDAFYGIAGEFIRTIEPHTEADPAAVLVQLLVAFGNAVGRGAWYTVERTPHFPCLFAVIVGKSATARKGVSWSQAKCLMDMVDPDWAKSRIQSGLSSGEGLIHAVRDPVESADEEGNRVIDDEGVSDKRLLIVEGEFARVFDVAKRESNTLSAIVRDSWDGKDLQSMTRGKPLRATAPHISIIGHITAVELGNKLSESDRYNGFANRFLWCHAARARLLPDGGGEPPIDRLATLLRERMETARNVGKMIRTSAASRLWASVYESLSDGEDDPRVGVVVDRATAQVLRLSMMYALMDGSREIDVDHLQAALAVWDYCRRSALRIFGDGAIEPPLVTRIREFLRDAGETGLTRTEIHAKLNRNQPKDKLAEALGTLRDMGQVRSERYATGKREGERWYFVEPTKNTNLTKLSPSDGTNSLNSYSSYPDDGWVDA